jgi:PEP-CTERM/exosortase A-associated glycosyltransferase
VSLKILHVLDHSIPLHSGYVFRTLSILKQQRQLGWETFHITGTKQKGTTDLEEEVEGWHFYRTPMIKDWRSKVPVISEMAAMSALQQRLEAVVETVKPDVIHAHSPVLNGIPALRVSRRHKIPLVYEVRAFWEDAAVDHGTNREWGMRYRATRALETWVLKRADAVTVICNGLHDDIVARGIDRDKVTVIPNAVNYNHFDTAIEADGQFCEQLNLKDKSVLGFIGSFYAYEGLALLLQALTIILKARPETRLLLVGGGPEEARLKELAIKLGLQDKVIFTGRVPHDSVPMYYGLIDVLVYPRTSMRLTELVTPLKPLEAMARGRMIVASSVGGHRELIDDRKTGYLFKAGDPESLAKTVLDVFKNKQDWPLVTQAARRYIEQERNWVVSVERYRQVYERATR